MKENTIIELKHKLHKIESAKQYMQTLQEKIEDNEDRLLQAEEQLKKENKDVEKLKSASLTSLLAWIKKDKEERLVKEENEAMRAILYVRQLEEERQSLQKEYERYSSLIKEEDRTRKQLEQAQLTSLPDGAEKENLLGMRNKLEEEARLQKELVEAIDAGYTVLAKLSAAERELSSAQGWGMYDIIGGGMVSSMIKHSHIDQAQGKLADFQRDLERFQKEVEDVRTMEPIELELLAGISFMDIAFDNFIIDFMVQSKINTTLESVQMVMEKIQAIQDELLLKKQKSEEIYAELQVEYQNKLHSISVA